MRLSEGAKEEIRWWLENTNESKAPIHTEDPTLIIRSDASLKGWGAFCESQTAGGPWLPEEQSYHINGLEFLAAFYALIFFCKR